MKRFFIITNGKRDKDLKITHSIQDYIESKGGESRVSVINKSEWISRNLHNKEAEGLEADGILVLGGDGTMVRAAREFSKTGIPLIGINLGNVGYLCELDVDNMFSAIDQLMEDKYEVESRMMIVGVDPDGEHADEPVPALNDIVIHRASNAQLINLVLTVNGEYLTTLSADGMILSTPTGSTGYNLSAGGPIVDPKSELLLITPINPQSVMARCIVVSADAKVEVMLADRRTERDEEAEVTFDGDNFFHMKVGDRIFVKKSDITVHIMRLDRLSFLQILRKKIT